MHIVGIELGSHRLARREQRLHDLSSRPSCRAHRRHDIKSSSGCFVHTHDNITLDIGAATATIVAHRPRNQQQWPRTRPRS